MGDFRIVLTPSKCCWEFRGGGELFRNSSFFAAVYRSVLRQKKKNMIFQAHLEILEKCLEVFLCNEIWDSGLSWYCYWWKARNGLDLCLQWTRKGARKCTGQNCKTGWFWHAASNQKRRPWNLCVCQERKLLYWKVNFQISLGKFEINTWDQTKKHKAWILFPRVFRK